MPTSRDPHLELLDDARHSNAVAERARERGLRQRDAEAATFVGLVRDLLESGETVTVVTAGERRHTGRVVDVARDHLVVDGPQGRTLLCHDAVAQVRPRPGSGSGVAAGDRGAVTDRTLLEALSWLADERPTVVVAGRSRAEPLRGRLVGIGEDLLTIRAEGLDSPVYVPLHGVAELTITTDVQSTDAMTGD